MLASCQSLFFLRESLLSFEIGVLNFQCRAGTFLLAFEEVFRQKHTFVPFCFFSARKICQSGCFTYFPDLGLLGWTDKVCILCLAPGTYLPCTNNLQRENAATFNDSMPFLVQSFLRCKQRVYTPLFIYAHVLLGTCEQSKDSQEITGPCERSYRG